MDRKLTAGILILIILVSATAYAESTWVCTGCGRRIQAVLGDRCPYCGTHDHVWEPATCTEPETCSCGETRGDPLGHTWLDATCVRPRTCAVCGIQEGETAGHQWDGGTVSVPATCVSEGILRFSCTVCGAVREEALPLDPTNHPGDNEVRDSTEAACTQEGYTGDTYCKACGAEIAKGSVIPAAGHVYSKDTAGRPMICTLCGHTKIVFSTEPDPLMNCWDTLVNGMSLSFNADKWYDDPADMMNGYALLKEVKFEDFYFDFLWIADDEHELEFMGETFDALGAEDGFCLIKRFGDRSAAQDMISDLHDALKEYYITNYIEDENTPVFNGIEDLFRLESPFRLVYSYQESDWELGAWGNSVGVFYYPDKGCFFVELPFLPFPEDRSFFFGRYEQDNDVSNGAEPIEWIIMDIDEGKALLLSRYALDCVPYVDDTDADVKTVFDTYLYTWLNREFLNTAFTKDEQAIILKNDQTGPGIFVLSKKEIYDRDIRRCLPTKYALARGTETSGSYCTYWTGDIADQDGDGRPEFGTVDEDGGLFYVKARLADDGVAVRPALIIDVELLSGISGE